MFWVVMSTAGLAVEYLFKAIRIPVPARPTMIVTGLQWNYTTVLSMRWTSPKNSASET
ncbi:xanthosine utilization system XapX-like protein [Nakamurella sp. UYEF19]|uniref:hypothetical protein n=1 Tax=Nakamurella sp. UYEF19 TaxID=1756392 RepID=UPI003393757E